MKTLLLSLAKWYAYLLRLYPYSYQKEFTEEMLLDFSDMAADASKKGIRPLLFFWLRELVDFPGSLLRVHLEAKGMLRMLRSQPVNYGLRGATGFGIGFATITLSGLWISPWLYSVFDPMLQNYSIWYWETFQNERWIWLLDNAVRLLSLALTGLFFGLLFALLAGDQRKRGKYLLAGSLAWFIPNLISNILSNSFGWSYFLSASQMNILGKLNLILVGMFYSTALIVAENTRKESLRRLTLAAVVCPLGAYLYIKLLFYLWLEITEWFFPALVILMLALAGSLLIIAERNDRKSYWIIMASGVAYPILFYGLFYLVHSFLPGPTVTMGGITPRQDIVDLTLNTAVVEATIGTCFGLLLGLIFGYQRQNTPSQLEGM